MARPNKKMLTAAQAKVYDFIKEYYREYGTMPTYKMIADEMGFSARSSAFQVVESLIKKGDLVRSASGTLAFPDNYSTQPEPLPHAIRIPIVDEVCEGKPILRQEVISGTLPFRDGVFTGEELFFYRAVREDKDLDIHEGDYLLCGINSERTKDTIGYKIIGNNMYYVEESRCGTMPIDGKIMGIIRFLK